MAFSQRLDYIVGQRNRTIFSHDLPSLLSHEGYMFLGHRAIARSLGQELVQLLLHGDLLGFEVLRETAHASASLTDIGVIDDAVGNRSVGRTDALSILPSVDGDIYVHPVEDGVQASALRCNAILVARIADARLRETSGIETLVDLVVVKN